MRRGLKHQRSRATAAERASAIHSTARCPLRSPLIVHRVSSIQLTALCDSRRAAQPPNDSERRICTVPSPWRTHGAIPMRAPLLRVGNAEVEKTLHAEKDKYSTTNLLLQTVAAGIVLLQRRITLIHGAVRRRAKRVRAITNGKQGVTRLRVGETRCNTRKIRSDETTSQDRGYGIGC